MKSERRNVLKTIFALFIFICSMFASFVAITPVALAANGDGEIVDYSPKVIVEETTKEIIVRMHNDNKQDVPNPICIDEIIITAPNDWTGTANLVEVTNMGAVDWTNEADDGSYSGLVSNYRSVTIVPDYSEDGVMLCPSGTTTIRISGLYAPDAPEGGKDFDFLVLTSDQYHNEPNNGYVRFPIDKHASCGATDKQLCSFRIKVTEVTAIKIEYLQFVSVSGLGTVDQTIEAKAWGAWGRLTELYVDASGSPRVDVYVDDGDGVLNTGLDYKIAANKQLSPGFNSITMSYTGLEEVVDQMKRGFIKDSEQGGSNHKFFIHRTSSSGTVNAILGHADEDATQTVDPTYTGTGFTNPPKEGTIIGIGGSVERALKVQLIKEYDGKYIDVKEIGIPIYFTTTKGVLNEDIETTDDYGEVENHLLPGTISGNADVQICMADPITCTDEYVGINAGAPGSFAITKGYTSTEVEAGDYQIIEVKVYDQHGNIISNNPSRPRVDFTILEEPDLDASLDDDTTPGPISKTEDEQTNMGIANMYLLTSKTVGDHIIKVCVEGLGCKNTIIHGVLGQADQMDCTVLNIKNAEITADQCIDVLVQVEDKNGNPLPKWESIVAIRLEGLDPSPKTSKYISNTNLREEVPELPDAELAANSMPKSVKGKLNYANIDHGYAWAIVTICGCEALGQFDIVCESDTLEGDVERLNVINSEPECVDVGIEDREDECDNDMKLHTSILDTCGNKLKNQECAEGGWASSCVYLQASCGELSTNKTCVDLRNTGQAPKVGFDISDCACGYIAITAIDESDCCQSVYSGALPQCDSLLINKVGPYSYTSMQVYPYPKNLRPDQFYVSEKTVVELTRYDGCNQVYTCDDGLVNIELRGEDCVDDSIQVDSPLYLGNTNKCMFENKVVHKVVIENCKQATKGDVPGKEWTDIPEKDDIIIDKIALQYTGLSKNVTVCIYEENEKTAGFQPGEDILWSCANLSNVPLIPGSDMQTSEYGAYDTIHNLYILELGDRVDKSVLGEYDNQRMGGALVEPQDTKDFYIVISSNTAVPCGIYDVDYVYFQDYNSPDFIEWNNGGHVRDTIAGSELYTRRNDNYMGSDPYPDTQPATPDYGFGDRILHNLGFVNGVAKAIFRDLVAETVKIIVDGLEKTITFKPQPATQVVALNHGDTTGDPEICDDGFYNGDCRAAMACSNEGYDINLQVTDGFQNQVALGGIKVQLEACLIYPHYIEINNTIIDLWQHMGLYNAKNPKDVCFDMERFRAVVKEIINDMMGHDDYFATIFLEGTEFIKLIEEIFEGKYVKFVGSTTDEYGHIVVYTDGNGRAQFRVESDDSSLFNMKSFDTDFRIFTIPVALDADYFDIKFSPGAPYKYDIMAFPETGIPADGEQESKILIRKLDECGNPVYVSEEKVTVTVDGNAIISRDFLGENNYDQDVTGSLQGCYNLWPWLEDCSLTVLDDVPETVTVTVEDAACSPRCNEPDSTEIKFVGAPRHLKITEIIHSDLLPADGFINPQNDPADACDNEQMRRCHLEKEPEICFQTCKKYGGSGAWVTVEVQDKYGKRVTGYLGDGLKRDPGDVEGKPDNVFEKICVALDNPRAFIDDYTFGWIDLDMRNLTPKVYCGDLAYGKGSFHVSYATLDRYGQPMDPRETASVVVSVFDICDRDMYEAYGGDYWDDYCNGQEYDENNLPDSEAASRLTADYGQLDYIAVPDRWNINTDKTVVAADGKDYATLIINPENEYFDVRTSMEATVQSSLLGSALESGYIHKECYVEGLKDPLNPTSIIVNTEACSAGQAKLRLSSIEPGIAKVTVTGNGYGCKEWINGYEYVTWFETVFGSGYMNETDLIDWHENCIEHWDEFCLETWCHGDATTSCDGLENSYYEYWYQYRETIEGSSTTKLSELYTPFCIEWGIIPLTPKTTQIEFKQSFQDKIELEEGWNFFSVPTELDPSNNNWNELGLNTICSASAMWNEASQSWVFNLGSVNPELEPMEGYWCYALIATTVPVEPLDITGVYLPAVKNIYVGWNDVGLSSYVEMKIEHALISIDSIYTQILDWIEELQRYASYANTGENGGGNVPGTTGTNNMEAGQGYFIWATKEGDLAGLS